MSRSSRGRWGAVGLLAVAALVLVAVGAVWPASTERPDVPGSVDGAAEVSSGLPWLATAGNRLVVAGTQDEVLLRGANVLRSEWDGSMAAERRAIPVLAEEWGGNVLVRGFASDPVLADDDRYLALLDEHVELAERHAAYVVLAWRSHTVNGPQPDQPDDRAQRALAALADRYHGVSHVMYALQVEPHDVTWEQLHPRFVEMVDAVRAAAAPHEPIVMVPGTEWSRDVSGALSLPVERSNIVYKSHPYNSAEDFDRLFLQVHDAGLPVFLGEFGPLPEEGMELDDVAALLQLAEDRRLSWAAWIMDHQGGPSLVEDNDAFAPTRPYGLLVQRGMRGTPRPPTS